MRSFSFGLFDFYEIEDFEGGYFVDGVKSVMLSSYFDFGLEYLSMTGWIMVYEMAENRKNDKFSEKQRQMGWFSLLVFS